MILAVERNLATSLSVTLKFCLDEETRQLT